MVSRSMTQVEQWSRSIVGGALVLAGLSAPATTSAMTDIVGNEVIVIEDEAPWNPSMGMGGHLPLGSTSSGLLKVLGGSGPVLSGGTTNVKMCLQHICSASERYKINRVKSECIVAAGTYWIDFDPYDGIVSICQYQALDGTLYRDYYQNGDYRYTMVFTGGRWVIDY